MWREGGDGEVGGEGREGGGRERTNLVYGCEKKKKKTSFNVKVVEVIVSLRYS